MSKTIRLILFGLVVVAVILWALGQLGGGGNDEPVARPQQTAPAVRDVVYRIGGTSSVVLDVTINNASGNTEQLEARSGFERTFEMSAGEFVYISVQNADNGGSIRCQILIDGDVAEEATSAGEFAIATCSGRVP